MLAGNPPICIDSHEQNTFGLVEQLDAKVLWVDLRFLKADLDINSMHSVELVMSFGSSDFKLITDCPIERVETVFKTETIDVAMDRVTAFEPTANTQKICTFGSTSGSTGLPKIVVYRNAVPVTIAQFENDLAPTLSTVCRGIKKKILEFL